jgi:sugar lactone lactonase YvrE
MYEALEFAGYDVKFEMGTEAHNLKQGGADLPDALRWLWRGYPEPIVVHEPPAAHEAGYDTSNRVFSTVYFDKPWRQIGGEYGPGESRPGEYGPRSLTSDSKGNVYFADAPAGTIDRADADGNVTQFAGPPDYSNVLRMGANGRLYTYRQSTGEIVSSNTATGTASDQKTVVRSLAGVDDFVVTQDGTIYFLDRSAGTIGRIDASGEMHVALRLTDLQGELVLPTALALSPDQSMLVVTDAFWRYGWSLQIAADGSLDNGEPFYRLETPETTMPGTQGSTGGAAEDSDGVVYFATPMGIQICMQNGRVVEILNPPLPGGGPLTAIAFAGNENANWLYVAQDGKLFRRHVKVTGANAWTVVKPPKPTL